VERGQAILVTGASGAIGFEIAAQAAACGAIIGVHGLRPERVTAAIDALAVRVPNAQLIALPADLRDAGATQALVDDMMRQAGRLDALVHCAIAGVRDVTGPLVDTDPAQYGLLAAQVLGTFQQLCFAALPSLSIKGGTIIGLAADSGRFAAPRQAMMGTVYAGIMGFVRNLALEVARDQVRVHCIATSFVADTSIFERFGIGGRGDAAAARAGLGLPTPLDIAPLALFLCAAGAARMTGQVISVNGGLNC